MKTGQVAKLLGKDPQTINNWADRFPEFFSAPSKGQGGNQRDYNDNDIIILNTIRTMAGQRLSNVDIKAALERGEYVSALPDSAAGAEITPVRVFAQSLAATQQLEETKKELVATEAALDQERRARSDDQEKYLREIAELKERAGRLEGKVEILRELLDGKLKGGAGDK